MLNLGDKSAAQSMTIIAAVIFAVIQTLEGLGVIPPGALEAIATCGKSVAVVLGVFGLRRAISVNGLGVILGLHDEPGDDDHELTDADFDEFSDDEPDDDYELTDADFEDEELPEGAPFRGGY